MDDGSGLGIVNKNFKNIIMHRLTYILLLCFPLVLSAQRGDLSNEGTLYVSPETLLTAEAHFINQATGDYTNDGEVLLRRNFHNDGLASFTPGQTGYTRFQGLQVQEISGSIDADFYDILLNNPHDDYSFLLSGGMYVFGEANFYDGIVDNFNYGGDFVFEHNATAVSVSDRSYVEGTVQRLGDISFEFPVGKDGMHRPSAIIKLEETPTEYFVEYHYFNSNSEFPHDQKVLDILEIDDNEYWSKKEQSDTEILIRLSWDERTTPLSLLEDYEALAILAWDEIDNQWISLGGIADVNEREVTSIIHREEHYNIFTFGKVRIIPEGNDFLIFNGVNPNDPGGNDYFKIVGLENFPDNRVRVYNRWGVLVFDETKYDTNNNVFRGTSNGRTTIKRDEELPVGTYFYIFDYVVPETSISKSIQGYLYLNR